MAKKVTINGSNLLSDLSQAWGGQNNSDSDATIHGTQVPAGAEWGMNRGEVERFIKAQLKGRCGAILWEAEGTYYSLLGFASKADRELYQADPSGHADLVIFSEQLPISTITSDSYVARLTAEESTTPNYVVKNGSSFLISLRYQSVFIEGATSTQSNYNANGTLTIERSVNGGSSWTRVDTLTGVSSVDPTATAFPIGVNLGDYLVDDMSNIFRVRASFQYQEDGVTKTRYSSYVAFRITSVNLSVVMATDWSRPVIATANTTQLDLNFTLYGAVQKYLTIRVDGRMLIENAPYAASVNGEQTGNIAIIDSTKAIFTHGLHEVEAVLTCSDGNGGTLTSETVIYRLMIANESTSGADLTQPYIMIHELAEQVPNFVQSKICAFSIYNPSGESIRLSLVVGASAGSIIDTPQTEYFRQELTAQPNTKYTLNAALEVEETGDMLNTYLHVVRFVGSTQRDFLYESISSHYLLVNVDNTSGYAPTEGSTFYLNPKTRNNSETNPARILNMRAANAEVESEWTNFKFGEQDGWVTDSEGIKVLRVLAGSQLTIKMNPFAQFLNDPASSMTMELDVCMRNVTNEDDSIIRLCEASGNNWLGLRMMPMVGTITTASHTASATSNFLWQEDVRTHISINICNAVAPNAQQDGLTSDGTVPTGTLPLVRVFINGVIIREFAFDNTSANEFCTGVLSNGGLVIGQNGADIDIYGLRIWANQQLSAKAVKQNQLSTLTSAEEKEEEKRINDIFEGNKVSLEKVGRIGRNWLVWHGAEIWHGAQSKQRGWWEFKQYDADGQEIPELSGTICKATASLVQSGQGTTAKTYYYWNLQTKYSDVSDTISVLVADLHSSISAEWDASYVWKDGDGNATGETGAWMLKGGCLGKNFPLPSESAVAYHGTTVDGQQAVVVPDGWIDGNGKYRGKGHHVATHLPLAQKDVLKINYASSMQSHIIGVNKLYNDLHEAYVGKNALQEAVDGAVVAKNLEPFLFFTQASDSSAPVYRGPGAWGAGKMDKPTWGYVKSAYPNFTMIEGADNNRELTDMRVPFDDIVHGSDQYPKVFYNPDEEAWYYRVNSGLQNAQKCIDFDAGKTYDVEAGSLDDTHLYAGEYPHANIVNYIRDTWNFLFLHNPRIKPFITSNGTLGSFAAFTNSDAARDTGMKYWCSDYKLYRYDFADGGWVDAGLWNGSSYDEVKLNDSTAASGTLARNTYDRWNALTAQQKADYEGYVNAAFVAGIVEHARANIGTYFRINSLKFHYCFINHFIAGTDNCSKNTYYVLVPVEENGSTVWKFELHQDDVDTVLATDNSGLQTKPYYIDRMHPYAEDDVNEANSLYEGGNNVLFNLCEAMWENTLELSDALRSILASMASLQGGMGSAASDRMNGVWKTLNRYIFDVQRYIPSMAYNEAARIRYEFPKLMGYRSDQRQVDPIEQSMGDQLQAELQWMKRRLVYMASYAAFGEFAPGSTSGTGISDLSESFAMVNKPLPNSTNTTSVYTFKLVPHQWLYPTGGQAQTGYAPHVRVAPGAVNMPNGYYEMTINRDSITAGDDGITIYGINYYRSIGNIGDHCFNPSTILEIRGKRLTSFVAEPTVYYSTTIGGGSITAAAWKALSDTEKANYQPAFRCAGVTIGSATRLSTLSMNGCSQVGGSTINLGALTRIESIDLRYTNTTLVTIPQTSALASLQLPASLTSLTLTAQPSLSTLTLQGYDSLSSLTITGSPLLGEASRPIVISMMESSANVTNINLKDIDWNSQPVSGDFVRWLIDVGNSGTCLLEGSMTVSSANYSALYYADVAALIARYGDIRNATNPLYIIFGGSSIGTSSMSISGKKYVNSNQTSPDYDLDGSQDYHGLGLLVTAGNDVAVATKPDGSTVADVTWEFVESNASTYAEFPDKYSPVVHFKQTGTQLENVKLTVRVTLTNTNGETRQVSKTIGLWNRVPEVGDFAWADGEFDNENDASKTLVGMVIRKVDKGDGTYELDILGTKDLLLDSYTSSNFASAWGPYPDNNQENGFLSTKSGTSYNDTIIEAIRAAVQTWQMPEGVDYTPETGYLTDVFNTPLRNIVNGHTISKENYQDASKADGYADQSSYPYNENFLMEEENAVLMSYADTILKAVIAKLNITQQEYTAIGCSSDGIPQTMAAVDALANLIVQKAGGVTKPDRYRQLLFPAVRMCNVWSPQDEGVADADLHENYRRGNWRLMPSGLMARYFNFVGNSRTNYGSGAIVEGKADETVTQEAMLPLFANAIKRGRIIRVSTGSGHWCSTEGSSTGARYVPFGSGYTFTYIKYIQFAVRPAVAFTFTK